MLAKLRARQERIDAKVEAHQQRLIGAGTMCPACRHTSGSDRASVTASTCGALDDAAGWGRDDVCDCRNLFHGR